MRRSITILFIFSFLAGYTADNIKFRHISTVDGLSDNNVNHITCDSQGFMWFATSHGLNRYDGYTFRTFTLRSDDPHSMERSNVGRIQEDAGGMLWLEYWTSFYDCFNPEKEEFHSADRILREKYGITNKGQIIYADRKKDLWVHNDTVGTILFCFPERSRSIIPASKPSGHKGAKVVAIGEDHEGILRMYSDGLLDHINKDTGKVDWTNDYLSKLIKGDRRECGIFSDRDGDYWIWGNSGIMLYHRDEDRWEAVNTDNDSRYRLNGNIVRAITCDNKGRVWIAIDHGGINVIDKNNGTIEYIVHDKDDDESLIQNNVKALYTDPDGGIWAGTFKCGVSYYDEQMFKFNTESFSEFKNMKSFNPDICSMLEDKNGNLYLGIPGKLVFVDAVSGAHKIYDMPNSSAAFPEDDILCMAEGDDGRIWIGTYQNGLLSFNPSTRAFSKHTLDYENANSDANKSVWSLALDKRGYLWIGTWRMGLWGIDPATGKVTRFRSSSGDFDYDEIAKICISDDGNLYMATSYGLLIYNPQTRQYDKRLSNKKGDMPFQGSLLSSIVEDSRGLLWISTLEGLNVYDLKADKVDVISGRLRKSVVHGVVEDNDKNIWVSSSDGIYQVVVSTDKEGYVFDLRKYCDFGIPKNQQFNPRALLKTKSGTIAFGGVKGMSFIDPADLKNRKSSNKVIFTDLMIRNKSVEVDSVYQGNRILSKPLNMTEEIKLDYSQNTFSVAFSALNYSKSASTGYMYKLEGFGSDWIFTSDNRASFSNVSPGSYILKVREVGDDGEMAEATAELKIVISPPFYRSWVAYVLYALLFAGSIVLVWAYIRHNEAQKYKLMKVRQEADKKHEVDDMKLRFFTNISHDLRTPLTLILTPLEYVAEHPDDPDVPSKIRMAHNNALRLLGMVNQLLDFRKSDMKGHVLSAAGGDIVENIKTICNNFVGYSENHNINLTFFSPVKSLYMLFDKDKIDKIIMNLLSNAFKFTPEGGRVDVSLDIAGSEDGKNEVLEIKVADNGCGISDEYKELVFERFFQIPNPKTARSVTGSGIGLNLVKEFVTLHNGTISVHDNIGKGTVFVVKIPIIRAEAGVPLNAASEEGNAADETPVETAVDTSAEAAAEETAEEKAAAQRKPTILIVDDNDDFRTFMTGCLKSEYTVYEASDGDKAWEMIPELQPDIVVSDVMMPGIDGNELCRMLKNDVRTSHILVILLSARSAKEHEQKGLEVGADDYITKPFNLNVLSLRIRNLLQRRRNSQGNIPDISPSKITITSLDEKLIAKAIRYVDANLGRSDLSVEELSGELGMSRVHLYKKLLSITGKTPVEFVRIMRLKRAEQLLRESQLNVSEIAYQTGFNNLGLFRKYFKKEYGVLPSEFQAQNGKDKS